MSNRFHAVTPELLTTIRKALGETLEVFSRRFIKPNGEPYDAGSLGVYSTGARPLTDFVDAAFRQALPGLLQSEVVDLEGRPAVLAAIMRNICRRRERLKLSVKVFADLIGYPAEAYRQAEGVYVHRGQPRRSSAEYLIPILEGLSALEAGQALKPMTKEQAFAARLDELEMSIAALRQTADALAETLAILRKQLS